MKPGVFIGSLLTALVLTLTFGSLVHGSRVALALAPGDPAPRLAGKDASSGQFRIVDWQQKRLWLVNFWATWCVPCQEEMPSLQKLYAARANQGLEILGVNTQEIPKDEMQEFLKLLDVRYPILETDEGMSKMWGGISALPASFLVDGKGIILRRYIGATPEQIAGLLADVQAVLEGQPMPTLVMPMTPRIASPEDAPKAAPAPRAH